MAKWKKAETSGGYSTSDIDYDFWCSCEFGNNEAKPLHLWTDGKITCPKCGKEYRMISCVYLQEKVRDDDNHLHG